jgi:hypothetical protein
MRDSSLIIIIFVVLLVVLLMIQILWYLGIFSLILYAISEIIKAISSNLGDGVPGKNKD